MNAFLDQNPDEFFDAIRRKAGINRADRGEAPERETPTASVYGNADDEYDAWQAMVDED